MAQEQQTQAVDERILLNRLQDALAAHLYQQARRLGLSFGASQLTSLCDSLLSEPASVLQAEQHYPARVLHESTVFDTYHTEDLEVHDYLHLVSQDMRKRLGQFVTPSVIVKYTLDAVGYQDDADVLDRRLIDPACGSGVFLVEALRVHLAALRGASVPIDTWYPRVLSAFVGVDVDPVACLYARFNLGLLLAPATLSWASAHSDVALPALPIYCLDTLRTVATELGAPRLFSDETSSLRLANSFDFVVGNPPLTPPL